MRKSVIVADDQANWRRTIFRVIKRVFPDVQIDQVETGEDLTERVLEGDYAVVITDNDMEEHDAGLRAIQQIRESGNGVPIYLIFGGSTNTAREALRYGVTKVYEKDDFDHEQLVADITKHLE